MAKSKSGGTRSYLRGRIASDVYSIGRDASGKKQQVVRSLAEQVKNPQTIAQMRGRMIMSTVMQAVSGLSVLIDHSFDNVPNGQPSISEFIRRNYALIKADVQEHPSSANSFGLNKYQEKGVKAGNYIISDGKALASTLASASYGQTTSLTLFKSGEAMNLQNLKAENTMGKSGFITLVGVLSDGSVAFIRLHLSDTADQTATISTENWQQFLTVESPMGYAVTANVQTNSIVFSIAASSIAAGFILSVKDEGNGYIHSESYLTSDGANEFCADVALPTYPVGEERFLNGGEL